jgi:hypothetical protein
MHGVTTAIATAGWRAAVFAAAIMMVAACGPPQTASSGTVTHAKPSSDPHPAASVAATTHTSGGICDQSRTVDVCEWPSPNGSQLFDLTTRRP